MEENTGMAHKIVLNNRDQGNLTGILDVISFDENTIVLDTDMGLLTIKGKDLHVNRLSLEKVRSILRAGRTALCIRRAAARRAGNHFLQNYLSSGKAVMKEFMRKNSGNRRK